MKVFLAHKDSDSNFAVKVSRYLTQNGIDSYLDCFDDSYDVEDVSNHIRKHLGNCSTLMAIISKNTAASWWVPWEIGIATEKGHPISTYLIQNCELPSYLEKWPYLSSTKDLDNYILQMKLMVGRLDESILEKSASERTITATDFHRNLKIKLGQ